MATVDPDDDAIRAQLHQRSREQGIADAAFYAGKRAYLDRKPCIPPNTLSLVHACFWRDGWNVAASGDWSEDDSAE